MKQFFFFLICPFILFGQTQIGQDIDGKDSYIDNLFGKSVSISADGTIIAAGAPRNDGIHGIDSGHVQLYKNIDNNWLQIGDDIDGEATGDVFGSSVSISADGSIVAVGAPGNYLNVESSGYVRIYQNINDNWVQLGNDINGAAAGDEFGYSVDLSSDGNIVAIGAQNAEYISIYENISGIWTQIGSTIEGEGDWFRFSLSLSDDGNTLAIGAPYSSRDINDRRSGLTRIYENISGTWTQIGSGIYGEERGDKSGTSVSLSANGRIVAIGAPYNRSGVRGTRLGHVRVFINIENVWYLLGHNNAELGDFLFGSHVSLSADGHTVAIGAPETDTDNYRSGLVRVYKYTTGLVWNRVGLGINGEGKRDYSGESLSLSSDGNTLVIGVPRNDGNGSNSGHVRVFENINETWTQIGNDIDGDLGVSGDFLGDSVSMSSDGTILAIGAPSHDSGKGSVRVYENINGNWIQKGLDIIGEANHDLSGSSVSISSDGNIVAIGAPNNDGINGFNSGHVRIYAYNNGNWIQLGADLDGHSKNVLSGSAISLSSDGKIIAIGAPDSGNIFIEGEVYNSSVKLYKYNEDSWVPIEFEFGPDPNTFRYGYSLSLAANGNTLAISAPTSLDLIGGKVYIYESINDIWTQKGSFISGEYDSDYFGSSISLAEDGNIIAIGAVNNNGINGSFSGHVRVYKNISNVWTQIGDDIDGEAANDNFGERISLSSDGQILAVGSRFNEGVNGLYSGHVRVYKNINDVWTQIGDDIDGEAENDYSGTSVSLSADGSIVAIGAPYNSGNGGGSGHVRIYDLSAVLSTQSFELNYFSFYPNPVKDELNINLNKGLNLKQVNIYNLQSQYLYSVKTSKIDVSNLSTGMYFIEVVTNKGKSAKKIVIE
jgi:hypothetical protein